MDSEFSVVQLLHLTHLTANPIRAGHTGRPLRKECRSPFVAPAYAHRVRLTDTTARDLPGIPDC
jgi:hypothetical protein